MTEKLHEVIFSHKAVAQNLLIDLLNPVITGWGNYFRHVVSKDVFSHIDHILFGQLKRWAYRRHPNKPKKWVIGKYFKSDGRRKWCFMQVIKESDNLITFVLKRLADIPIVRLVKIMKGANPFDSAWDEYFEVRRKKRLKLFWSLKRPLTGVVPV